MKTVLRSMVCLIVLMSTVLFNSCAKEDEPKGDGANGDSSWNTYPAKTDLWNEYKGCLDKSLSQLDSILTAKGYTKVSSYSYRKEGLGYLDVIFTNSLSTRVVCEENSSIRSFEDVMPYSNGLASMSYSSYSAEISLSDENEILFSTRSSFLERLKSLYKNNISVVEECTVSQVNYHLHYRIEEGLVNVVMLVEKI